MSVGIVLDRYITRTICFSEYVYSSIGLIMFLIILIMYHVLHVSMVYWGTTSAT